MRRLVPEPAETTVDEQVAGLDYASAAGAGRPYLITNFALTLDGHATIEGRSGKIGSETDTAMLVGLRTRVDAVMIGAGTMRAEGYGNIMGDPTKREHREREGLPPIPLMVIVSGRLDLPWDAPLFADGEGEVVIFTYSDAEPPETETLVEVVRHDDEVNLVQALAELRNNRGVRSVLCEGGPRLHAQLLDARLVDELFVTHAPKLPGGHGPGLVVDLSESKRELEVAWLLYEESSREIFARYLTGV